MRFTLLNPFLSYYVRQFQKYKSLHDGQQAVESEFLSIVSWLGRSHKYTVIYIYICFLKDRRTYRDISWSTPKANIPLVTCDTSMHIWSLGGYQTSSQTGNMQIQIIYLWRHMQSYTYAATLLWSLWDIPQLLLTLAVVDPVFGSTRPQGKSGKWKTHALYWGWSSHP